MSADAAAIGMIQIKRVDEGFPFSTRLFCNHEMVIRIFMNVWQSVPAHSVSYFSTCLIRFSKSSFCMAPICTMGLPLTGMKRKVGMLCMPNVWASSFSLSTSIL